MSEVQSKWGGRCTMHLITERQSDTGSMARAFMLEEQLPVRQQNLLAATPWNIHIRPHRLTNLRASVFEQFIQRTTMSSSAETYQNMRQSYRKRASSASYSLVSNNRARLAQPLEFDPCHLHFRFCNQSQMLFLAYMHESFRRY